MCAWSVAAAVLTFTSGPAQAEEFRSSDLLPAVSPTVQAVEHLGALLHNRTGGRHHVQVVTPPSGETDNYTVEQVRAGKLAMARVRIATFHRSVPVTAVPSLPYLFNSTSHLRSVLDGPIGDEILSSLDAIGLVGLCFYDTGSRSFYGGAGPVRHPDDLRGMRVRVQSSDILTPFLKAMGAIPRSIPFAQLHSSLKTRLVDAAELDLLAYHATRQHEVARYYSLTEHSMAPSVLVFSKRVWNGLSKEDQDIVRGAARDSVGYMRQQWDGYEPVARRAVQRAGVEIVTDVDRRSFAEAFTAMYPDVLTNADMRRLVEQIRSTKAPDGGRRQ